jgi:O-acetyl-ADP-ribose deacetylase (regulator of RNase III)
MPGSQLEIVLSARDEELSRAWTKHCGDLRGVRVDHGSILDVPCDAVVSPANSFGFMDGGLDLVYSEHFGWDVQKRVQEVIRTHHHGELLVGQADIVETGNAQIPYLIAAPTMRVPDSVERTVHPYLAARAVLLLWKHGRLRDAKSNGTPVRDVVRTLAIPGLGTGTGQVPADSCARQVRAAWEEVVGGGAAFPKSLLEAMVCHAKLRGRGFVLGEDEEE